MSEALERRLAARRRAELVSSLRQLARPAAAADRDERRTAPAATARPARAATCAATRYRPTIVTSCSSPSAASCACARAAWRFARATPSCARRGTRVVWLDDFELSDELWARSRSRSASPSSCATAPPAASSRSIRARPGRPSRSSTSDAWEELGPPTRCSIDLEPDAEALIVNRMAEPPQHAIAPIDECYRLVGLIKASWEGISGGAGPEEAIAAFFDELRARSASR